MYFNPRLMQWSIRLDHFLRFVLLPFVKAPKNLPSSPTNILIFEFHLLGDIVMLTPLLMELRRKHPQAHIGLVSGPWAETILDNHPGLFNSFYAVLAPWVMYDYSLKNLCRLIILLMRLRRRSWDWGVEVRGDLRQILMLWLTGAKRRISFNFTGGGWLLTDVVPDDGRIKHIVQHHLQIIQYLYPETKQNDFVPQLWLSKEERLDIERTAKQKIVGLHLGASLSLRILPEDKALDLLKFLLNRSQKPVLLFNSKDQGDFPELLVARLDSPLRRRVRIKTFPLRQFIVEVAKCSLFVGMDSAGGHIATALGVPVWSIFGPAYPEFCKPIGQNVKVLALSNEQLSCRPCDQQNCTNSIYQYCFTQLNFHKYVK